MRSESSTTTHSRRTTRSNSDGSPSPSKPAGIDGESITGISSNGKPGKTEHRMFRYTHSPSAGGFGNTPLFLNPLPSSSISRSVEPLLSAPFAQALLPSASDLLKLMLSTSSPMTGTTGIICSWMGGLDPVTLAGRIRLLTCLGYLLLDNNSQTSGSTPCPLTWGDVRYLRMARKQLASSTTESDEVFYLISLLLEDMTQKDLSLKFRLENVLDFNDQITLRGWMDGGRDSVGTHSEELRAWFADKCKSLGISSKEQSLDYARDLSPIRRPNIDPHEHRTPGKVHGSVEDPFCHDIVETVIGGFDPMIDPSLDEVNAVTPKSSPASEEELERLREIIVVDVQTDHALRRHINKAMELRKECSNERIYVAELRKFIQRRVFFETQDTRGTLSKLARARGGFLHIGDVRSGAHSRHFAILFKTLCDATGVYCRLVRDEDDTYYNIVMISDNSFCEGLATENRRELNHQDGDDDVDDAPEELMPVFWEPAVLEPQKRIRLGHALDCLLQKCNNAADPVDLDEFFDFDQLLGKGSFGEVWKVHLKHKTSRKNPDVSRSNNNSVLIPGKASKGPFALKLIPPEEADKEEASFMRIYSHPRVINVIAVFRGYQVLENRKRELERKPAMCILMELADKCLETVLSGIAGSPTKDTREYPIRNNGLSKQMDLRFVFKILIDSARAMAYLHSPVGQRPHLVHRDLKPGNILISDANRAIVTDFGVARMNPSLETNLTVGAGTEGYMAPEQKTLLYDRPADVYSFGVIISRIMGIENWKDAGKFKEEDFNSPGCDPVLSQLCLRCVQSSPLHRPSFEQIHQLLLAEFIRREFSRSVLSGASSGGFNILNSSSVGHEVGQHVTALRGRHNKAIELASKSSRVASKAKKVDKKR